MSDKENSILDRELKKIIDKIIKKDYIKKSDLKEVIIPEIMDQLNFRIAKEVKKHLTSIGVLFIETFKEKESEEIKKPE